MERHLHKAVYPPPLGTRKIFSVQGKAAPQSGNRGRPDLAGLIAFCVEGRWRGGNGVAAGLCLCWVVAGHDIRPVVSVTARSVCELMKPCLRLVIRPRKKGNRKCQRIGSTAHKRAKTLIPSSIDGTRSRLYRQPLSAAGHQARTPLSPNSLAGVCGSRESIKPGGSSSARPTNHVRT